MRTKWIFKSTMMGRGYNLIAVKNSEEVKSLPSIPIRGGRLFFQNEDELKNNKHHFQPIKDK